MAVLTATHIASKLYTITPPRTKKEQPSPSALGQLFDKMDSDKESKARVINAVVETKGMLPWPVFHT